jgi:hypothetical protein
LKWFLPDCRRRLKKRRNTEYIGKASPKVIFTVISPIPASAPSHQPLGCICDIRQQHGLMANDGNTMKYRITTDND